MLFPACRQRVSWTAEHLGMQQRATPQAACLLVIAAGLDVKLVESRLKMLRQATGGGGAVGTHDAPAARGLGCGGGWGLGASQALPAGLRLVPACMVVAWCTLGMLLSLHALAMG
jgi:hypothetical protein